MDYQELRDYALQCSLEHHLCNVDDLMSAGKTAEDILEMLENDDPEIVVWEPYEGYESPSITEAVEDMRGVNFYNFMYVLTEVNGDEWAINFKKGKA